MVYHRLSDVLRLLKASENISSLMPVRFCDDLSQILWCFQESLLELKIVGYSSNRDSWRHQRIPLLWCIPARFSDGLSQILWCLETPEGNREHTFPDACTVRWWFIRDSLVFSVFSDGVSVSDSVSNPNFPLVNLSKKILFLKSKSVKWDIHS